MDGGTGNRGWSRRPRVRGPGRSQCRGRPGHRHDHPNDRQQVGQSAQSHGITTEHRLTPGGFPRTPATTGSGSDVPLTAGEPPRSQRPAVAQKPRPQPVTAKLATLCSRCPSRSTVSARERDCPPGTGDEEPRHPRTMGLSPLPVMLAEPTGPGAAGKVPGRMDSHGGHRTGSVPSGAAGATEPLPSGLYRIAPKRAGGLSLTKTGGPLSASLRASSLDVKSLRRRPQQLLP